MMTTGFSRVSARRRTPFRRRLQNRVDAPPAAPPAHASAGPAPVDIAPDDPLLAYFLHSAGATELDRIHLDFKRLRTLIGEHDCGTDYNICRSKVRSPLSPIRIPRL